MLPGDPYILLSYVNTKLRDEYGSLSELCAALGENEEELRSVLEKAGYRYDPKQNRFL